MFDAKRLLGQVLSGQLGGGRHHGRDRYGDDRYGGGGGSSLEGLARGLGGGSGSGALIGGLASVLLGSKKGRRMGGSAVKLGGLALVGSLAYRAYQDWQASQARASGQSGPSSGSWSGGGADWVRSSSAGGQVPAQGGGAWSLSEPPRGTAFNPASEAEQQDLSRGILRAMIAAAKADGHIDGVEQANIFAAMDKLELDADDKAFVMDELRGPLDVDAVAREARNPEQAAELYAASLLAIDVDNAPERGYLAMLAARLKLDDALVQHLHTTVEEAGRTP